MPIYILHRAGYDSDGRNYGYQLVGVYSTKEKAIANGNLLYVTNPMADYWVEQVELDTQAGDLLWRTDRGYFELFA